ncbi:MAG: hypothetical protein M0017_00055 [Desulfobacteraceae bacterium]|nr:hypothetical protein [Desulfobacteraceae bacterium]
MADYMSRRPVAVKLGYTPSAKVLKIMSGDQRYAMAEWEVLKVIFYFGSLVEKWQNRIAIPPEYYNMFKTIETASELDPYNMDGYYFAEAAFTWEVGHAQDVNYLLDRGMRYRTWDYLLPFFAGFNASYFLKSPQQAAPYFQKAAELSGNPLFTNLAARYFQEADQTEAAIRFLTMMIRQAPSNRERQLYQRRLDALQAIRSLQERITVFQKRYGRKPRSLQELVATKLLPGIPADPYGGTFYLDGRGRVKTTSKMAPVNKSK